MSSPTQAFKGNSAILKVDGLKIANCTSSDVNYNTNAVDVPMSDGLGISKGFPLGEVNVSTFETVDGLSSNNVIDVITSQTIVSVEFTQGGKTFIITGTGKSFSKKSTTERGMTDGSSKFTGAVQVF